ncbi:MAG: 1-(5-phosphoribosyl)-5-[(5-phosphoribosylamino)methylideneamino]imidazole-4-carboxamide isomerase [Candidatus Methylacidiphilales bacterium]|nr:1-(5-phosphoribosyl)-5-[(5-phosphoribosylamino)methylideneamino]imidazole-4-carboxamide isomerase [Candidatus Methylacidiphilales bacterium]
MIILPAIDLRGGQVVRLQQGRADAQTQYSDDPVAVARDWEAQGAVELHVVDLDGAFDGIPRNLDWVRRIAVAVKMRVELGGGLRDIPSLEAAFNAGVARAVLGTRAADSLEFVEQVVKLFGSEHVAVGIDAKNGFVATKGWTETTGLRAVDLAKRAQDAGAGTIIYTDIATDGMFTGPNFPSLQEIVDAVPGAQVIASGGVATADHVKSLRTIPNLYGAIVGKALYDKRVTLAEIL